MPHHESCIPVRQRGDWWVDFRRNFGRRVRLCGSRGGLTSLAREAFLLQRMFKWARSQSRMTKIEESDPEMIKNPRLIVYKGGPHSLCLKSKDRVNADLLSLANA